MQVISEDLYGLNCMDDFKLLHETISLNYPSNFGDKLMLPVPIEFPVIAQLTYSDGQLNTEVDCLYFYKCDINMFLEFFNQNQDTVTYDSEIV